MAKTRQAAQITEKIARNIVYNPNENLTGIGNATARQVLEGYNDPNVQAAIDELYYISTINIGDIYPSKSSNNPNPSAWSVRPQIEDVTISGAVNNTFWYTVGGIEVELTEGDDAATVAGKIQAALDADSNYIANVASPNTGVLVSFVTNPGSPSLLTSDGAVFGIDTTITVDSASPEVQLISVTGTVAIQHTIEIKDSTVSPEVIASFVIDPSDTLRTITQAYYDALQPFIHAGNSPQGSPAQDIFSAVDFTASPIEAGPIRLTYFNNTARTLQDVCVGGIFIKGTYVQTAISESDILTKATKQKDLLTVNFLVSPAEAGHLYTLSITDLGLLIEVDVLDTEADIATKIYDSINSIPGVTAVIGSPNNTVEIEYDGIIFSHLTDYTDCYGSSGTSIGITNLGDSPQYLSGTELAIEYTSLVPLSRNGELGYGQWKFYGEKQISGPSVEAINAISVGSVYDLFAEPFTIGVSPNNNVVSFAKNSFNVGKFLISAKHGGENSCIVFSEELTFVHDGSVVGQTENVLISSDSGESEIVPIDVEVSINGDNIEIKFINNTGNSVEVSAQLMHYEIINSSPDINTIYYWERIG